MGYGTTGSPRPDQFTYKTGDVTRNQVGDPSMMEKYCSNSVSAILNWGDSATTDTQSLRITPK